MNGIQKIYYIQLAAYTLYINIDFFLREYKYWYIVLNMAEYKQEYARN